MTARSDRDDDAIDARQYLVVVNDEGQYSIWPADEDVPAGWATVGVSGPRDLCLQHIASVWTDMRPKSVRAIAAPSPPTHEDA